jgi:hypothetical protein
MEGAAQPATPAVHGGGPANAAERADIDRGGASEALEYDGNDWRDAHPRDEQNSWHALDAQVHCYDAGIVSHADKQPGADKQSGPEGHPHDAFLAVHSAEPA